MTHKGLLKMSLRTLSGGLCVILLSGCSFLANQSVKVRSVDHLSVDRIEDDTVVLEAGVRLENRSSDALTMKDVNIGMTLGDRMLPGTALETVRLKKGEDTVVALPIRIPLASVDESLLLLLTGPDTPYEAVLSAQPMPGIPKVGVTLSGQLNQSGSPTIRLAESLGPSLISVESVKNVSLGLLGVSARVQVSVKNPFLFGLRIEGVDYTLNAGEVSLGQGRLEADSITVPAQGETLLEVDHRAAWPVEAIRSPGALVPPIRLRVTGHLQLGGRLHGRTIPFETDIRAFMLTQ